MLSFFGSEPDEVAAAFDESGGFERRKFCAQCRGVRRFELVEIDAGELTKAEEHFFFVGLVRRYGFDLFGGKFARLDRRDVKGRVVLVRQRVVPLKECAPAPKPRYGSRRQYFRLWRDAKSGLAQLEIS